MVETLQHYGATLAEWEHFQWVLGLTEDLLPVVSNPGAKISPKSSITEIGKVPSIYNREHRLAGIKDWPNHITTEEEIQRWKSVPDYGACIQTRFTHAFDNDVPDPALAAYINAVIQKHILLPVRWRPKTGKCLHAFAMKGNFGHREIKVKGGIVEFLGNGQHFVAAGTHKSGDRYEWRSYTRDGKGYDGLPEEIPEISAELFEKIWAELIEKFAIEDVTTKKTSPRKQKGDNDEAKMRADPIAEFLEAEVPILSRNSDGSINFSCPWKETHTKESGDTETTYFPAGSRGYQQGHFVCQHAHCKERTDQDFLTSLGYYLDQYSDVSTPEDAVKEQQRRERLTFMKVTQFARRKRLPWLIKGILPRGETMTFGASGSGKTFAILDMACCLVLGIDWNGHKTKRSRVAYICAEGAGGFISRIQAWAQRHNVSLSDLDDWLIITPDTPNFMVEGDVKITADRINDHFKGTCDFIVIDTLAQVTAGADENSTKDMGLALRHAKLLGVLTGAGYNLVHHTGKDEDKGARGSSVIKGQLDAMFYIFRKDNKRTFWIEKMKDGRDQFGYVFDLENETVGRDEDDDPITSCVVVYAGAAKGKKEKRERKRGRWQTTVLAAWEAVGGGNVTVKEVMDEVMRSTVADKSAKRDRREEYASIALENLAQEGIFTLRDGAILIEDIDNVHS